MESFASRLPTNGVNRNNEEQNRQSYLALSQFDAELQQQARLAMQQEMEVWQDFDNYLPPIEYNHHNNTNFNEAPNFPQPLPSPPHMRQRSISSNQNDIRRQSMMNNHFAVVPSQCNDASQINANTHITNNNQHVWNSMTPTTENKVMTPVSENVKMDYVSPKQEPFTSPQMMQPNRSPNNSMMRSNSRQSASEHNYTFSPQSAPHTTENTPLHSPQFTAPMNFQVTPRHNVNQNLHQRQDNQQPNLPDTNEEKKPCPSQFKRTSTTIQDEYPTKLPQQKKIAHNAIERRYRNNINDRITELKNAVPALLYAKVKDGKSSNKRSRTDEDDEDEDGEEYLDGVAVATKLNKATILRKATEYILHLKRTADDLRNENETLQVLLGQMPGGPEVLSRYCVQKVRREQETQRQRLHERAARKREQQKQKKAASSRKRSRVQETPEYESCSSSNSSDPLTPPFPTVLKTESSSSITNRVFMVAFMAISFFSTSPLSAGPTTKEQYENHHHISRTAEANATDPTVLSTMFPLSDKWSAIRTTLFFICLFQLLSPMLKYWFSFGYFKIRKVGNKSNDNHKACLDGNASSHISSLTPGDQKCMQIYNILVKSIKNDGWNTILSQEKHGFTFYLTLGKEMARFVSRHWLHYEIFCDEEPLTPQEQWVQVCKWIKLNEVECLGGNPNVTRCSMLYSCFHLLNLIESMEDDENEYVEQSRSRVYATTAMQMALVIPHHGISEMFSKYFWQLAMYESGLEEDPLMRALVFDCHEDDGEGRIEAMLKSSAWSETLEVMNQQIERFGKSEAHGLSLSMTAPVLVPVGILSTLHLLDNLQTQFGRLIISVTAKPLTTCNASDFNETAFAQILEITDATDKNEKVDDYHRLAHWLAAVGATVDALWKSDTETAEKLISTLVQRVPRSLVSREITAGGDIRDHKDRMNQLDELTKKNMIHILVGATLLKKSSEQHRRQGIEELWKAERIKANIKRIKVKSRLQKNDQDLESSVLALAEFVTHVAGLEAWISAWRLAPVLSQDCDDWEITMTEQVRHVSLDLRRMIRRHSLDGLRTNQAIVERLSRLCAFVSSTIQIDEVDSACDCSELDDEETKPNESILRRSEKALEILRGLS